MNTIVIFDIESEICYRTVSNTCKNKIVLSIIFIVRLFKTKNKK